MTTPTTCPTCGSAVRVVGKTTQHFEPIDMEARIEEARREAFSGELPELREWLKAYSPDLFKEGKPPYTLPESSAAAMGRHILGILIEKFEAKARTGEGEKDGVR